MIKPILWLFIVISFSWAFLADNSVAIPLQATSNNSFQKATSVLHGKNNLEEITQGQILEPLTIAGITLLMTNLYYNNCYNPKSLAAGLFLMTAYGLSAGSIDEHVDIFLAFTCLPVWYYLGFQAKNYQKDETFSQSVSLAAKGFVVSVLLDKYLNSEKSLASQNMAIIYQLDKVGVSYKF